MRQNCIRFNMTIMVRLFLLSISVNIVAFGIILQDTTVTSIDRYSNFFNSSLYPPVHGDLRFGGSSGLFFLHLIKHKLHKLQQLEKIQTTTQQSQGCICVPYYQCDANNNIILTGLVIPIDIRYRSCTGNFEVCCFLRITPMPTTMPTTMTPTRPPTRPPTMSPTMSPTWPPTRPPTSPPTLFPPTIVPPNICYCVFTFQCINGFLLPNTVINTPGIGLGPAIGPGSGLAPIIPPGLNPRQNQVLCLQQNQVCCRIYPFPTFVPTPTRVLPTRRVYPSLDPRPNTLSAVLPTSPQSFMSQLQMMYPNFAPGQTCICIPTAQCNVLGYFPISEYGTFNPLLGMGSLLPTGSLCANNQETCCTIIFSQTQVQLLSADSDFQDVKYPGTGDACRCVHSSICTGENIVHPEGFGSEFGICLEVNQVCCRIGVKNLQEATTVAPVGLTASLFTENECGLSSNSFAPDQSLSVDSGKTYFAEFPWMVAILLRSPGQNDVFLCGGSVINSRAVLTAAHCANNHSVNNLVARFGEWDTNSVDEPLPFQEQEIEAVILHPEFFSGALYHDVALLILKSAVRYSLNIKPICLPYQDEELDFAVRCYATGWGQSGFDTGEEIQSVLRKIDLPLINHEDCQNRLRQTRLGQYFQLHGSFICAGGENGRDTCRGDGGGPLVCPISTGQFVQVGIVSWGIGCGTLNPAVYSKVANHRFWIDQQLANYGL